jgi:polyisoprenyl-phosphate glycosyltransferase
MRRITCGSGAKPGPDPVPTTFSIVVPVHQNEDNLPDTIPKLLALAERLPKYTLELVLVDDGSTDRSLEIITRFAEKHPATIKVVKLTRRFGQTPATQAGLSNAAGDCVGIISADLQEPHELFVDMIREWERGARFVIGERAAREEGRRHQAISNVYWNLVRNAFPDFPQLGYDFCLLDRQVVENINCINEKNSSIFVLIYWLGYKPVCLPVTRRLREKGRSRWSLLGKIAFTVDTLIGFTYFPARLITALGFVLSTLCVLYLVFLVALRTPPHGWLTVVGLILLLGAMLLFSLGIVAEYLLRILDEARKRPPFVVEWVKGPAPSDRESG